MVAKFYQIDAKSQSIAIFISNKIHINRIKSSYNTMGKNLNYTNTLVNADSFYANFTNTTFQKIIIPHLTRTMKQKFLH